MYYNRVKVQVYPGHENSVWFLHFTNNDYLSKYVPLLMYFRLKSFSNSTQEDSKSEIFKNYSKIKLIVLGIFKSLLWILKCHLNKIKSGTKTKNYLEIFYVIYNLLFYRFTIGSKFKNFKLQQTEGEFLYKPEDISLVRGWKLSLTRR